MPGHLAALPDPAPPAATKRGRRQSRVDPSAGPVAGFAHELVTLKLAAGDPSYDRMRQQLGAQASKSALSAAARGEDLPSWETTWEFVRCLAPAGTDLDQWRAEWRARWEAVNSAAATPMALVEPERKRRRSLIAAGVFGLAGAGVLGGWLLARASEDGAPKPPLAGDAGTLVRDVTVPDGSAVAPGETFVKVWEYRNVGKRTWKNRYLQRQPDSQGDCRSTGRVAVPPTPPGESVTLSVEVIAPGEPGDCLVYWKMVDEQGRQFFPTGRPLFYQVTVRPG